jgi:hypothetical protein
MHFSCTESHQTFALFSNSGVEIARAALSERQRLC